MGFFNQLFGGRKRTALELHLEAEKRLELWHRYLENYPKREQLAKYFSYASLRENDVTSNDYAQGLMQVLAQIESLIGQELIDVTDEQKADEQIMADLRKLTASNHGQELYQLTNAIARESGKQKNLLVLFRKLHDVLKAELHAIQTVRKFPEKRPELLQLLSDLIFTQEGYLYKTFNADSFTDRSVYDEINLIARAILLEEELKEKIETAEDKFVNLMIKIMGNEDSAHHYRKLGESIYEDLVEEVGDLGPEGDITEGIRRLEELMKDDALMQQLVKRARPKYNDEKISWTIKAFRKAYELGHFDNLEGIFVT